MKEKFTRFPESAFEYAPQAGMAPAAPADGMPAGAMPGRMPAQPAPPPAGNARALDPESLKREIDALLQQNLLPEDFDLEAAVQDPAFVRLVIEMPAYAAVRVYQAEKRAAEAERNAMQAIVTRLRAREGLPRAARADTAAAPARDYLSMSPEEFAKLEHEYREKARRGVKVKL